MSELPDTVVDEAERLSRRALAACDTREAEAYRRDRADLLGKYGFEARVRDDDSGRTLVLYPRDWVADGTVRTDRIEDTGRAIERSLSGPGRDADWETIEAHNRAIVDEVERAFGPVHAENVAAFADFMGNHYLGRIESASRREIEEFLGDYFPRNAWPSDEQLDAVEESLRYAFECCDVQVPPFLRSR